MRDIKRIKGDVLAALQRDFESHKVPVVLRSAEGENLPTDILTTLHRNFGRDLDEAMGEFYFFPVPGEDTPVLYFSSVINLTEDVEEEFREDVAKAVSVLNFYLECGAFVMNPQGNLLAFKFISPILADLDDTQIIAAANVNVGHSLQISERYADCLLRLCDGRETLEHFMELMPQA